MAKKTLKKKSFADLVKLKQSYPVYQNYEEKKDLLFTLEELSHPDFEIVYQKAWEHVGKGDVEDVINKEMLPFILRKMLKSDEYEINGLSDNEITETVNGLGEEIALQISEAIQKLLVDKIFMRIGNHLKQIKDMANQMNKLDQLTKEVEVKEGE